MLMSEKKEIQEGKPEPMLRLVSGRHNQLLGEREMLLTELQVQDTNPTPSDADYRVRVVGLLDELTTIDAKIATLKQYFSQEAGGEET